VILVAASVDVARAARAEFARHNVRKTYVALVFGRTRSRRETWKARLAIRKERGTIRTQADSTGVAAETEVESLLTYPGQPLLSLIALHPRTGRSHQLRAQCQKHRLPIVGDATYGDFTRNRTFAQKTGQTRLFLHSLQTELTYHLHGKAHSFMAESPVPHEFEQGS
jgi:23S rRNA-/tRNA-specific pseudouridylate synthase